MTRLRWYLGSLILLFTLPAAASISDLRVTLQAPDRVEGWSEKVPLSVTVKNIGPDAVTGARLGFGLATPDSVCASDKPLPLIEPGASLSESCNAQIVFQPYTLFAYARVDAPEGVTDPFPNDNFVSKNIPVSTPSPDLSVGIAAPTTVDPGLSFPFTISVANIAHTVAQNVQLVTTFMNVSGFRNLPSYCSASGSTVTCTLDTLEGWETQFTGRFTTIQFEAVAVDASQTRISATVVASAENGDPNTDNNHSQYNGTTYRTFFVTNRDDSGKGSLRTAITASATCSETGTPCKIAFRIPPGADAVQIIAPATRLPRLVGGTTIVDGETQTRYFGDTNPSGPEVMLSGRNLDAGGNGLEIATSCAGVVRGLIINNFFGAGIYLASSRASHVCSFAPTDWAVTGNYIGTDATGTQAAQNVRGIVVNDAAHAWLIRDNIISGNSNSGVYVAMCASGLIEKNKIGLDANLKPLGNGASGIYLGAAATGTDANDNYIGFNRHAGISIDSASRLNAFAGNSFQANGSLAIDYNLDGVTDTMPSPVYNNVLRKPVIASARYDAASDTTIIEGTDGATTVNVYANDAPDPSGYGEGQYVLGEAHPNVTNSWTFVAHGNLTGKWIAATNTVSYYTGWLVQGPPRSDGSWQGFLTSTSEFSRAVQAQ
ncbi:MAG TPA: NosD domain-containing protein [Thermoanaerobaculia bacterium]|nr:NosD domain-containing protein [Thermoanaerobaculia bacterium]